LYSGHWHCGFANHDGPFNQIDCYSSEGGFPLVAKSAGFSCVGMYWKDVPLSDLICFNLFVTNVTEFWKITHMGANDTVNI